MSNQIKSIAPDGNADGGFYAVTAAGHPISAKAEKSANVGPLKGA